MTQDKQPINPKLDLVFERIVNVSKEKLWKGWTEPETLKKWFCPRPWKTVECEIDLRPGGIFSTTMQSPEGEKFPGIGCYLEVIKNKKLVWTNALLPDFRPASEPKSCSDFFFTATIFFETFGRGKTKYRAIVTHGSEEDRKKHEALGFEEGWGKALDQLIELSKEI